MFVLVRGSPDPGTLGSCADGNLERLIYQGIRDGVGAGRKETTTIWPGHTFLINQGWCPGVCGKLRVHASDHSWCGWVTQSYRRSLKFGFLCEIT